MDKRTLTLLLIVFVDMIGFGLVFPTLTLLVDPIGGTILSGIVIAIFSLFQFVFSPILGRLSDKYGRRPILIVSSIINALSYFLIFVSQSLWIILISRMIAGIGSANISVAQAYAADTSEKHERTKKMSQIGAAFGLGFIVGPVVGGVVAQNFGIGVAFVIPAILSLFNAVLIFQLLPESNKNLKEHINIEFINIKVIREVLQPKNISFLLYLFLFANLALALIMGVLPILASRRFGWNESEVGYYFMIAGIGAFVTQAIILPRLLKKFDETKIVRIALLVFGIAIISLGLVPLSWMLYVVAPFTSFGFSLINIGIQALISLESNRDEQGIVLGVAQSFGSLARVFGPIIGGLFAYINISLPYLISGVMSILILAIGRNSLKLIKAQRENKN